MSNVFECQILETDEETVSLRSPITCSRSFTGQGWARTRKEGFWVLAWAPLVSAHHLSTHQIQVPDKSDYFTLMDDPPNVLPLPSGEFLAKKWGWMSKHHVSDPPEPSLPIRPCSADKRAIRNKGKLRKKQSFVIAAFSIILIHTTVVDPWLSTHCPGPRETEVGPPRDHPRTILEAEFPSGSPPPKPEGWISGGLLLSQVVVKTWLCTCGWLWGHLPPGPRWTASWSPGHRVPVCLPHCPACRHLKPK